MTFRLSTCKLAPVGAVALATLLAACSDHAGTIPTPNATSQVFSHSRTFKFTGKPQRFKVPHVQWLQVVVQGAGGDGGTSEVARGGRVVARIPASLDRVFVVYVGGTGSGTSGGYNGGGDGASDDYCSNCSSYGGGGESDIRLSGGTLGDRVLVAGGGGGGGGSNGGKDSAGAGGSGGGSTGASGSNGSGGTSFQCPGGGGSGGSQTAGGAGGAGGECVYGGGGNGDGGRVGDGGGGGVGGGGGGGGGAGGGFYGGGGGGGGASSESYGVGGGGGGGGGSSYVGKRATHSHVWQGWKNAAGNGVVVISW